MENKFHNIIAFYNKKNDKLIGYLKNDFDLTDDIYLSKKFNIRTDVTFIVNTMIDNILKVDWTERQKTSKHVYGHLYERWFEGLLGDDIEYKILIYENELRRLKLNRFKK